MAEDRRDAARAAGRPDEHQRRGDHTQGERSQYLEAEGADIDSDGIVAVPPLDQQDPDAAARLLRAVPARIIVLSFPTRSLGGHARGMAQNYRQRAERLMTECADVITTVQTQEFAGELVYIVTRRTPDAASPSPSPSLETGDPTHG